MSLDDLQLMAHYMFVHHWLPLYLFGSFMTVAGLFLLDRVEENKGPDKYEGEDWGLVCLAFALGGLLFPTIVAVCIIRYCHIFVADKVLPLLSKKIVLSKKDEAPQNEEPPEDAPLAGSLRVNTTYGMMSTEQFMDNVDAMRDAIERGESPKDAIIDMKWWINE